MRQYRGYDLVCHYREIHVWLIPVGLLFTVLVYALNNPEIVNEVSLKINLKEDYSQL